MIYIHVPFCHRKCTYCAFYSTPSQRWVESYVDRLLEEIEERRGEQPHPIRTVYFGGGTPTMLGVARLERIAEGLRRTFDLSRLEEATLEANPEDLTPQYLGELRSTGFFNRISIGVQSLDDGMLRLIGRRHTAAQAIEAVERARQAGFRNISVDFIYGLPSDGVQEAFDFRLVEHVSAYALTVEPGTALARQVAQGKVVLPGDDEVVRQYIALRRRLEEAGIKQYEVSNYARPGYESVHNSRYWDRTPYTGFGPGAHSFDGARRWWNSRMDSVGGWWQVEGEELLTETDAYNELLMTALRTVGGLEERRVPEARRAELRRRMQVYVDCGWIEVEEKECGTVYRPSGEGLLHADGMAAELFE